MWSCVAGPDSPAPAKGPLPPRGFAEGQIEGGPPLAPGFLFVAGRDPVGPGRAPILGAVGQPLNARRRDFLKYIEASGYIDQNSYRGVRGFWYHTYGLDPALSYALIAREWGVDYFRDPTLGPRLRAAIEKTALGITDYAAFRSVGNRGSDFSTDPNDAKAHVHQLALNLYPIAAREFGIQMPRDRRFEELSRLESYSQTSGMLAACYYSGR